MIKTTGENKMKQEFSKIYKLESQIYELQNNILKEFIKKAENKAILGFLKELSDNQNDTLNFTGLLSEINELKLYELKIGSKVPKDFDDIFIYHFNTDYDEDGFCKLFFEINDDNIIEDIQYEAE
jgi:hypothetical protein